jgi:uridine kinase
MKDKNLQKKNIIVGIAGGTSSGKTTICNALKQKNQDIITISLDDYYKPYDNLTFEKRLLINFDHPKALDYKLLIKHIEMLKNNKSINKPMYSFTKFCRTGFEEVKPKQIILIEGIYSFYFRKLQKLCDFNYYIDVDENIRFERKLKRDEEERGRTKEFIINQYTTQTKPMHDKYVSKQLLWAKAKISGINNMDETVNKILNDINKK